MDEDKRWEYARLKLSELGSVPASFSCLIRAIRSDQQKNTQELGHIAFSELKRLIRGPAALAPFLGALLEFRSSSIEIGQSPAQAIAKAFKLEEICALVSCVYLNRQIKKRIIPEEWKFIVELIAPAVTTAGHLGTTIPAIGFERAIFTVCSSVLGMALFQPTKVKEYAAYRRVLKKNNTYFDTALELKFFNCSGREVCSLLSQSVGQSSTLASEYLSGLDIEAGQRPKTATHALNIWMKSLLTKGSAPQEAMDAKWYPTKAEVEQIELFTKRTKDSIDTKPCWLMQEGESLESLLAQFGKLSGQSLATPANEPEEDEQNPEIEPTE